jgi:hypothetical protein
MLVQDNAAEQEGGWLHGDAKSAAAKCCPLASPSHNVPIAGHHVQDAKVPASNIRSRLNGPQLLPSTYLVHPDTVHHNSHLIPLTSSTQSIERVRKGNID